MNVWANTVITSKGNDLLAKLTQGNTLDLVEAVAGTGFVTPGLLQNQTEVTNPKQTLSFRSVSYPGNGKCALPMVLTNDGVETGYEATQLGVYANDPDEGKILFFIAQSVSAEKGTAVPSETEMPGYSADWTFYLKYGQADGVTVTVDPANTVSPAELAEFKMGLNGVDIVAATGDGLAYTATIPNLTELKKGLVITIIPDKTSTATIPSLNVNGLGAKNIKQRIANNTSLTAAAAHDSWMIAGKPVPLMYDGSQWVTITGRPSASALYGIAPITSGGTGADNAEDALKNLGAVSRTLSWKSASPSSVFAGQTIEITIPEDGYDVYEIAFRLSVSYFQTVTQILTLSTSDSTILNHKLFCCNEFGVEFSRNVTIKQTDLSTVSLSFSNANYFDADGNAIKTDNSYIIPITIHGIKGTKDITDNSGSGSQGGTNTGGGGGSGNQVISGTSAPLVLYGTIDNEYPEMYLNDSSYGDEALEAILTGRQILVRVPDRAVVEGSGSAWYDEYSGFTASFAPIMMYQLPNRDNDFLYLFYLRDEKQTLNLSAVGMGTIEMPVYGQLKMKLSQNYSECPLDHKTTDEWFAILNQ